MEVSRIVILDPEQGPYNRPANGGIGGTGNVNQGVISGLPVIRPKRIEIV